MRRVAVAVALSRSFAKIALIVDGTAQYLRAIVVAGCASFGVAVSVGATGADVSPHAFPVPRNNSHSQGGSMSSSQLSRLSDTFLSFSLLRRAVIMGALVLALLLVVGGVAASTYYVVMEQAHWHDTVGDAASQVPFPLFTTSVAQVESVQVLEDTPWTVVHINYVLPDGNRFAVTQQPMSPQIRSWEGENILSLNVQIGDGGVLYMAEYISPDSQDSLSLPSLVWGLSGVELHLQLYPETSMSADELVSLARTFHVVTQTDN